MKSQQQYTLLEKPAYWDFKKRCFAFTILFFAVIGLLATASEIGRVLFPLNELTPLELPVGQTTEEADVAAEKPKYTAAPKGECKGVKSGLFGGTEDTYKAAYHVSSIQAIDLCEKECNKYELGTAEGCLGYMYKEGIVGCRLLGKLKGTSGTYLAPNFPYVKLKLPTEKSRSTIYCAIAPSSSWFGRRV